MVTERHLTREKRLPNRATYGKVNRSRRRFLSFRRAESIVSSFSRRRCSSTRIGDLEQRLGWDLVRDELPTGPPLAHFSPS
jgi:hypothetical protein